MRLSEINEARFSKFVTVQQYPIIKPKMRFALILNRKNKSLLKIMRK